VADPLVTCDVLIATLCAENRITELSVIKYEVYYRGLIIIQGPHYHCARIRRRGLGGIQIAWKIKLSMIQTFTAN